MQAMILAAGFGTRLLPHTLARPKPLFPILNQPLLLLTVARLKHSGFSRIIVNCHHLKEQIVEALKDIDGVIIQEEETILGTGGGLRRALDHMTDEPLLVTNGDIYHTISYRELYDAHLRKSSLATLAMHDYSRFNNVAVRGEYITEFTNTSDSDLLAFTGLHILNPELLEAIPGGEESCIIKRYKELLKEGEKLSVYRSDDCYWTDMGTPEDYLRLHEKLLNGVVPRWKEFGCSIDSGRVVSSEAQFTGKSMLKDWCAIGAARGRDVQLSRVVVWDGVEFPDGYVGDNKLISASPVEKASQGIE